MLDDPHNLVKFGIWGPCTQGTTKHPLHLERIPSPPFQRHCALWLCKNALNFGGAKSHKKTNLPFFVEGGALVPA